MRLAAALLASLAFVPAAWAIPKADADKAVADFVAAPGFEAMAEDLMDEPGSAYAKRFTPDGGALRPDAEVGPVEKALLIVETMETTQPDRVRYAVTYGQVVEDGADTISLVEVRRYNLGPLIREDVKKEYGPENTGDETAFGVGPDVAWRFAFAPAMGNLALPLSISHRVIADGTGQMKIDPAETCPAGLCRDLMAGADQFDLAAKDKKAAAWKDMPEPDIGEPAYSATLGAADMPHVSAARMARWTTALLKLTEMRDAPGQWKTPATPAGGGYDHGEPFLVLQLDQNLGQDIFTVALGGLLAGGDPGAAQTWVRAVTFGEMPPDMPQKQVVRR